MALRYVERYASTRAKLTAYLTRKVRERGWEGPAVADVAAIVARFAELNYVDDAAFAATRTASLMRRGYGPRRVAAALHQAGVGGAAEETSAQARWEAAVAFARLKRIGPFAAAQPDRAGREKAMGAMLRAGHEPATARRIVQAEPGRIPTWDDG